MTVNFKQAGELDRDWLSQLVLDENGQPLENPNYVPGSNIEAEKYKWTPLYHNQFAYVNGTTPIVNNPYIGSVDLAKMELALGHWMNVISYSARVGRNN